MTKRKSKFLIGLITTITLSVLSSTFIMADEIPFFSSMEKFFVSNDMTGNKHPFISDASLSNIGDFPLSIFIDVKKMATYDPVKQFETHEAQIILNRDIKLLLYNGKNYAPFVKIDNPDKGEDKYLRFAHDKLLWCDGSFENKASALNKSAATCKSKGVSDVELVGDYDTTLARKLNFVITTGIPNINNCELQMYDFSTGELLNKYKIGDLVKLEYVGCEDWAETQPYINNVSSNQANSNTLETAVLASTEAPDGIATTKARNLAAQQVENIVGSTLEITDKTAITNNNGETVGVTITMDYAVDSTKKPSYIRCCEPDGNILFKVPITSQRGTVTQEFPNLTTEGTKDKPYTVKLITVPMEEEPIVDSFTYTNTSLEKDNTWSDHIPVISYSGLTGVPTYPRNTKVPINIVTDVPATIKANGRTLVSNGTEAVYNVTQNGEVNLMAEANGQFAETTVSVNEFTDEIVEVTDADAINSNGDTLDKTSGMVYDKNGNVKGMADGNGNILDAYGNKIGSYNVSGNNVDKKEAKIDEGEKLTQTGIYTPTLLVGFVVLLLGVIFLFGGKLNEQRKK